MKHLNLDDIKIPAPDFKLSGVPKGQAVSNWLIDWVKHSLEYGIADIGDFIPSKHELAAFLGVSSATIQNSVRYVKNLGYFTSKQSTGTCIADFYSRNFMPLVVDVTGCLLNIKGQFNCIILCANLYNG